MKYIYNTPFSSKIDHIPHLFNLTVINIPYFHKSIKKSIYKNNFWQIDVKPVCKKSKLNTLLPTYHVTTSSQLFKFCQIKSDTYIFVLWFMSERLVSITNQYSHYIYWEVCCQPYRFLFTAVALYFWYRGCRVKHQDKVTSFDHRRSMATSKP